MIPYSGLLSAAVQVKEWVDDKKSDGYDDGKADLLASGNEADEGDGEDDFAVDDGAGDGHNPLPASAPVPGPHEPSSSNFFSSSYELQRHAHPRPANMSRLLESETATPAERLRKVMKGWIGDFSAELLIHKI